MKAQQNKLGCKFSLKIGRRVTPVTGGIHTNKFDFTCNQCSGLEIDLDCNF